MTDDPRDVLKAAGAECAEVDAVMQFDRQRPDDPDADDFGLNWWDWKNEREYTLDAILALARLVAKYKRRDDEAMDYDRNWSEICGRSTDDDSPC